jgi:hypothetical protein
MVQKPIARSVIAAVVVAGMLTLCLVATKPLTNTAFAKTSCDLGILAYGHGGGGIAPVAKGETTSVDLNVGLSCPAGSPVSGATINVSGEQGGSKSVTTDFRGGATATFDLGPSSTPYGFKASYAGDSQHDAATATTGFFIDEK